MTYSIFSLSEWFRSIFSCRALSVSWSDPQSLDALVLELGLGLVQLLLLGELIMSMGNGDDEEDNDRDIGCVLVHLLRLGDLPPPSITFYAPSIFFLQGR